MSMTFWEQAVGKGGFELKTKTNELEFVHSGRQYEKYGNDKITISMKSYIQNLTKTSLALEHTKQLDNGVSATGSHVYRGINGSFQLPVKVLQRRQGQARARDLIKANDVVDEVKHYDDFSRVFALKCSLIRVSDASLGGVDQFGCPTDRDSKIVNVQSQAEVGIFIGETCRASGIQRQVPPA